MSTQQNTTGPRDIDEETNSKSSQSESDNGIDSRPTSPSHSSTPEGVEYTENITIRQPSTSPSTSPANVNADDEVDPETELFAEPSPVVANSAEILEFSYLAAELSLFASCIASSPPAPSPALQIPTSNTAEPDKTPTQTSDAERQRSQAQALIEKEHRKAELKTDLMELISDENGPNSGLIFSIDQLLRDWKVVHEGLERWRREKKGQKIREMFQQSLGE